MNGLRIYINPAAPDRGRGDPIFYSRRANGPYYRWSYEKVRGQWLGSRMHSVDFAPRQLSFAPWKGVPSSLKACLNEHYLE